MKLIQATPKNLYIGCKVYKNKISYYVYKINDTTVWVGIAEPEEVLSSVRKKLIRFSDKMESIQAEKLNYANLFVNEEDAKRVEAEIPGENTNKKFLKNCCESQIEKWRKTINGSSASWKNSFSCPTCKTQINPVKIEKDNVLFSVDYEMFYYNLHTRKYKFYKTIGEDTKKKVNKPNPISIFIVGFLLGFIGLGTFITMFLIFIFWK